MDFFGNLDKLPGTPQMHRWADWAEVLCLLEGGLTSPDFASNIEKKSDDIPIEATDDVEPGQTKKDPLTNPFASPDQFKDAVKTRAADVFKYLEARSREYSDSYPFELAADGRKIMLREMRPDREMYLFLLACAAFRWVPEKGIQTRLAGEFERLSVEVLRLVMPPQAETHLFGTNPSRTTRYGGNLAAKITQLSIDIREKVLVDLATDFEPSDPGDNGLDIVSWLPSRDSAPGLLTVFAQCACTPDWVQKQHSSSHDAWQPIFRFTVAPVNYCFIPFHFRNPEGNWYSRHFIHSSVLMDRRRIMDALGPVDANGNFQVEVAQAITQLDLTPLTARVL